MIRLLLVEDDAAISEIISNYLKELEEYEVYLAKNIDSARSYLNQSFDVILLDVMLPDGNGIDLCEQFRLTQKCPILFISCISDDQIIFDALSHGGDDYITKPFSNIILDARIKANLRRVNLDKEKETLSEKSYGLLKISPDGKSISVRDKTMILGNMEFRILTFFIEHPLEYYSSRELYKKLWGKPSLGDTRTVLVHIHNLRKKLEIDASDPKIIRSVPKRGYIFDPSGLEDKV